MYERVNESLGRLNVENIHVDSTDVTVLDTSYGFKVQNESSVSLLSYSTIGGGGALLILVLLVLFVLLRCANRQGRTDMRVSVMDTIQRITSASVSSDVVYCQLIRCHVLILIVLYVIFFFELVFWYDIFVTFI